METQSPGVAQVADVLHFLLHHEINTAIAALFANIRDGNTQETKLDFELYYSLVETDLHHYLKKLNYEALTEEQKDTLAKLRTHIFFPSFFFSFLKIKKKQKKHFSLFDLQSQFIFPKNWPCFFFTFLFSLSLVTNFFSTQLHLNSTYLKKKEVFF